MSTAAITVIRNRFQPKIFLPDESINANPQRNRHAAVFAFMVTVPGKPLLSTAISNVQPVSAQTPMAATINPAIKAPRLRVLCRFAEGIANLSSIAD